MTRLSTEKTKDPCIRPSHGQALSVTALAHLHTCAGRLDEDEIELLRGRLYEHMRGWMDM